jgi:hypothetical protein
LQLVQQRCPRVLVNPALLLPAAATGQKPPAEVDPAVALDEPLMPLVASSWQVRGTATLCSADAALYIKLACCLPDAVQKRKLQAAVEICS